VVIMITSGSRRAVVSTLAAATPRAITRSGELAPASGDSHPAAGTH
jgi:hypothetical protein